MIVVTGSSTCTPPPTTFFAKSWSVTAPTARPSSSTTNAAPDFPFEATFAASQIVAGCEHTTAACLATSPTASEYSNCSELPIRFTCVRNSVRLRSM